MSSETSTTLTKPMFVASFFWGMSQVVKIDKHTMNAPLTHLFIGSIVGAITGGIGAFVGGILPTPELKQIGTGIVIAAIVVQKASEVMEVAQPYLTSTDDNK